MMEWRYLSVIVPIDLFIFLFLWFPIALWMRLFDFYRPLSLVIPVILGSACWVLSLYLRYGVAAKARHPGEYIVIATVVCFIVSIQVIRSAISLFGKREDRRDVKNVVVREILPTELGEWLIFGAIFTGWAILSGGLGVIWMFPFGVFVVLFISRTIWRRVSRSQ